MNPYEFIANLNHDLRNPICTINNLLYLLRREVTQSSQLELLDGIETANDEIQFLLNHLLDFSKLQSGSLTTYSEFFTLSRLISQLVGDFKSQTQSRNILLAYLGQKDLHIQLDGNKPHIQKLLQLVLSLLVTTSRYSQISIDSEISQSGHEKFLHLKFLFQGSIEENQRLIKYFAEDLHAVNLNSIPKTNFDLRLMLCKAFMLSLNAELHPCVFDPQTSHIIISIPITPATH